MTEEENPNAHRWPWNHTSAGPPPPEGKRPAWWRPVARKRWDRQEYLASLFRIPHVTEFDAVVESFGGLEGLRAAMSPGMRQYLDPMAEYMDEKREQL